MIRYGIGISILICLFVLGCGKTPEPVSNMPESREGTIIESSNPSEVMVEAKGIGETTTAALLDARRVAVWTILSGGTDPVLQTQEERAKFGLIQEEFYATPGMNQYISWEAKEVKDRLKLEGGKKVKITKSFKVNKKLLKDELVRREIIPPEGGSEDIGLPIIMVIPDVPMGENPIDALYGDAALKHAAQSIESYLTTRLYDAKAPEQSVTIDSMVSAQSMVEGKEEDLSYELALIIGSDIYITYTLDIQTRNVGGSTVRKAIVGVRAFESTTARLLGTETGYSQELPSSDLVVTEEAIHGAIDAVLSRINAYWKKDMVRGIQYKLIVTISADEDFDGDERDDIAFAMSSAIKKNSKFRKENIITKNTLDYSIWVDPEEIDSSTYLYGALRRDFATSFRQGKLSSDNINRKILRLKVTSDN